MLAAVVIAVPASAATTSDWADWQPLTGTGGAYTTSVEIAAQPALSATVTSDSRAGQVGVISGASTWLAQGTPIGAKYGTSQNQPYLNLRPKADNGASPSTTTYSFNTPTPTSGWAFALGDIDADSVRIQAIGVDGQVLQADDLGFRGGFNYCAPGVAGKPSCTGDPGDVPTWNPATLTLTGNAGAADTSGAAAWFEPSTPITSLSIIFTWRAGSPIYQTWFASLARDITGSVDDVVDGPLDGVTLTLTDADGTVVGTTTTAPDGTYSFLGVTATDGYSVSITPPGGKVTTTPTVVSADLSDTDAVADFEIRDIIPVTVSGEVVDGEGNPVPDVTVTVGDQTTTTGQDGRYVFTEVPPGIYTATITAPPGFTVVSTPPAFTVPEDSEDPVEDVDFALARLGSFSGTVTADDEPVGEVMIEVTGPGGTQQLTTDADGTFGLGDLPPGTYTLTVIAPDGTSVVGPATRTILITAAGEAIVDQDFALAEVVVPSPSPSPSDTTTPTPPGTGEDTLPGTGLAPETFAWATGGGVVLVLGATLLIVARRRSRRD